MTVEELLGTMTEYGQNVGDILAELEYAELVALHKAAMQMMRALRDEVEGRLRAGEVEHAA